MGSITKHFRPTKTIERLNQEIRSREKVIRIFTNDQLAIRIVGSVLKKIEIEIVFLIQENQRKITNTLSKWYGKA